LTDENDLGMPESQKVCATKPFYAFIGRDGV
jgi:hypothetical protein